MNQEPINFLDELPLGVSFKMAMPKIIRAIYYDLLVKRLSVSFIDKMAHMQEGYGPTLAHVESKFIQQYRNRITL